MTPDPHMVERRPGHWYAPDCPAWVDDPALLVRLDAVAPPSPAGRPDDATVPPGQPPRPGRRRHGGGEMALFGGDPA